MNFFYIFTLIIVSQSALSATWKSSSYLEIEKIYPFDKGLAFFTSYSDTSVSSCDNGTRFMLYKDDLNYEVKASALMAAFIAKKKILFRYDADQNLACEPKINRFLVQ